MTGKAHLWPETPVESDGKVISKVIMESPGGERNVLWYTVPVEHRSALTRLCDPYAVAVLFKMMKDATGLFVHGQVSPSLLRNLDEFQEAWACWLPRRYKKVEIVAETEKEPLRPSDSQRFVAAFSGGVDAGFTAWRHRNGLCGRQTRDLQAGVMVHGFDIPLEKNDVMVRAAQRSGKMLDSLGMQLIPIATNFRELGQNWVHSHGAGLVSCLMMLQGGYAGGLIGSSSPYHSLHLPWGSNPLTDRMMSSNTFEIIHDGASFIRREKIREIAKWPEAMSSLRVCWEGTRQDRNCGRCEKCIRTILSFRVMGFGLPGCFEQDVSDDQILALRGLSGARLYYLEEILSMAKAASLSEPWVRALERCVKKNRRMTTGLGGLWGAIRKKAGVGRRLRQVMSFG